MNRLARAASALLLLAACGRAEAPARRGERPRPPLTRIPSEGAQRRAEILVPGRLPAPDFDFGPHALLRDSAALLRFWNGRSAAAPPVDFREANVLALRVFDTKSLVAAAPRVSARGGMTFVALTEGAGPPRPTGADSVALFVIPTGAGPVRYIAYEAAP
jgi:hypothetical protein